jgi:hypothetical protein
MPVSGLTGAGFFFFFFGAGRGELDDDEEELDDGVTGVAVFFLWWVQATRDVATTTAQVTTSRLRRWSAGIRMCFGVASRSSLSAEPG